MKHETSKRTVARFAPLAACARQVSEMPILYPKSVEFSLVGRGIGVRTAVECVFPLKHYNLEPCARESQQFDDS